MRFPDLTPASGIRWFLIVAAVSIGGFYFLLHRIDNAMPVVDPSGYAYASHARAVGGLAWETERCRATGSKLVVSGWIARKGHGASRRRVRVVVTDARGRLRALTTSLRQRDDVSALLNERFGDTNAYRHAGFTASLDRPPDGLVANGGVFLAYDDETLHVLVPLACPKDGA